MKKHMQAPFSYLPYLEEEECVDTNPARCLQLCQAADGCLCLTWSNRNCLSEGSVSANRL